MALLRVPLVVWCVMRWRHLCHSSLVVSRVKVVLRGLCHSPQVVVQLQMGRGGEQGSVSQLLVMRWSQV